MQHAHGVGFRLVFSRDEQRERPEAIAPSWRALRPCNLRAVWPTDAKAGGTWIAGTEHGMVLCMLNCNPEPAPNLPLSALLASRGEIIPALLGLGDVHAVMDMLRTMELNRFAPFRLLAIEPARGGVTPSPIANWDIINQPNGHANGHASGHANGHADPHPNGHSITQAKAQIQSHPHGSKVSSYVQSSANNRTTLLATWDRAELRIAEIGQGPVCLASSGLGDSKVLPRIRLFLDDVVRAGATPVAQDRFHHHVWPATPEISVLMSREEARTVSITTIEVVPALPTSASSNAGRCWDLRMVYSAVYKAASVHDARHSNHERFHPVAVEAVIPNLASASLLESTRNDSGVIRATGLASLEAVQPEFPRRKKPAVNR